MSIVAAQSCDPVLAPFRAIQNPIDTHYETLRHDMRALIRDLGITTEGDMAA